MSKACDEFEILISGYLDGELDEQAKHALEEHVKTCSTCRREYQSLKRLAVGTSMCFHLANPPDAVWDTFLDNVYNRMERRTGWFLFLIGALALAVYSVVLFFYLPWASALVKVLITIPVAGLFLLFVSVLRQRLRAAQTDRYSREVHR
jgi:predicted anti-sigma-YlaC factor YlaD